MRSLPSANSAFASPAAIRGLDPSARLAEPLRAERSAQVDFLLSLARFDDALGWRELGHPTLLAYLSRELGLSNAAAYQRRVACDLLRKYPELEQPLRDGRLCFTKLTDLARVITDGNVADVLPRFSGRVDLLTAGLGG
jgi:hypothetical protein